MNDRHENNTSLLPEGEPPIEGGYVAELTELEFQ
jgi:hypothetical protein